MVEQAEGRLQPQSYNVECALPSSGVAASDDNYPGAAAICLFTTGMFHILKESEKGVDSRVGLEKFI